MKKLLSFTIFLIFVCTFFACEMGGTDSYTTPICFSKIYDGSSMDNNAVEFYNPSDEDVDLSELSLDIYLNGSKEVTVSYPLQGIIQSKSFFLLTTDSKTHTELIENSDLSIPQLRFSGDDVLVLSHNGKVLDIIGTIGLQVDYYTDITLVRKKEYLKPQSTYEPYYFFRYSTSDYTYLKSLDYVSDETLQKGPSLTELDYSKPFFIDSITGGGGVTTVRLSRCIDGDTAIFIFDSSIVEQAPDNFSNNSVKIRFNNIDTPESTILHQEWGKTASNYTCNALQNAKKIEIQTVENYSAFETFGRLMGNVWIDGELLNFRIVQAGYSNVAFGQSTMSYNSITYTDYLRDAVNYATYHQLGLFGTAKDPLWDYENQDFK